MIPRSKEFKKRLPQFLANQTMRRNIRAATRQSVLKRGKAVAEIPGWEELREEARRIKSDIIEHLPEYLDQFSARARSNGIHIRRAATAAEANRIVYRIAREHGVQTVIKAKSMLSEEIGLNDYLIGKGLEVLETDLGEYIIQLAGEPPSHLTGPAVHKSRKEIAELFTHCLGVPYNDDPEVLTAAARKVLREKFLTAGMGVTGANFALVKEGGIVVVENEGNARLCAKAPPLHVALIGIERLIPGLDDLSLFLSLLTRSAVGQRLTSFVSFITGPRLPGALDGPEQVYFILVDNGRSAIREEPRLKELLHCIRCGACYNTCPVYQNIGGHAYGWVYQGPIGSLLTPLFLGYDEGGALPFASSLCGSCSQVCPVKIPLHELLLYERQQSLQNRKRNFGEALAMRGFAHLAAHPARYRKAMNLARLLNCKMKAPLYHPGWVQGRKPLTMAPQSFRDWWAERGDRDE